MNMPFCCNALPISDIRIMSYMISSKSWGPSQNRRTRSRIFYFATDFFMLDFPVVGRTYQSLQKPSVKACIFSAQTLVLFGGKLFFSERKAEMGYSFGSKPLEPRQTAAFRPLG